MCKICHFNTFRGSEIWFFMNLSTFSKLNFTKSTNFKAVKLSKMDVLVLLDSPKLISRKIWNFHTVLSAKYKYLLGILNNSYIFCRPWSRFVWNWTLDLLSIQWIFKLQFCIYCWSSSLAFTRTFTFSSQFTSKRNTIFACRT